MSLRRSISVSSAATRSRLHVAEGDALVGLLEGGEHIGGNQLAGLDHTHGVDCRPPAVGGSVVARFVTNL
jgi:hypothetical protein